MIDKDYTRDLCYFIRMINVLLIVYVKMALRKELMNLNVGQIHILRVEMMKINNRKNLMIKSKDRVVELYTKDYVFNLDFEKADKIKDCLFQ